MLPWIFTLEVLQSFPLIVFGAEKGNFHCTLPYVELLVASFFKYKPVAVGL